VALLRVGQLHVQFLEARLAGGAALLQLVELGVDLGQFVVELAAAGLRGLGLLRQAQQFHLQLVGAGLRLAGLAARDHRRCEASV
jgi:hypothetical protein